MEQVSVLRRHPKKKSRRRTPTKGGIICLREVSSPASSRARLAEAVIKTSSTTNPTLHYSRGHEVYLELATKRQQA